MKFLSESFGEAVFVFSHTFNKKLIKSEQPDIVLQIVTERNVDLLLLEKEER
jgi:hypothetical protein